MRVLSVIHYPVFSGPHNRNVRLGPLLGKRGIELTLLLPAGSSSAVRARAAGADVVELPLSRLRARLDPRLQVPLVTGFPREVRAIRRMLRERHIDMVLINGLVNPHAAVAARREGLPVVWQLTDTFPPLLARRAIMQLVTRLADVVMSTGSEVARQHPGTTQLGDRLILFFPPVDLDEFRPDAARRSAARTELGLPADAVVVGNISTLSPMKGHGTFLRAAAALRETHPDVRFVILGASMPDRPGYLQGLERQAAALGLSFGTDVVVRDPGPRVAELASAFDVFWMTSEPRSEGIPTVIGEAMALALPVVATDVGSAAEAVVEGETGWVVAPHDADGIARATAALVDDPDLRRDVGGRGRARARLRFAIEVCAERHAAAFAAAAARRGAAARSSAARA